MIVYGDHADRLDARAELRRIADALEAEGVTADAFVDAAAVTQGLLDAEFHVRCEVDGRSPLGDALMAALTDLARALLGEGSADPAAWRDLARGAPAGEVEARLAEGYAFYALHPLAYARAARKAGLGPQSRVLGLRSIGTGLAAMVAAAAGAPPPVTARPVGHPFARRLNLAAELAAELGASPGPVAIVDEGPGLSGSSFLAAAQALQAAGVGWGRLVLMPSHDHGPGAQAPRAAQDLWRDARRVAARSDGPEQIAAAFEGDLGAAVAAPQDLSAGAWRARVFDAPGEWPAVDPSRERRKLLTPTSRGVFLLKWAGLGADARAKRRRGETLAAADLSPTLAAWRNGWLAQPWTEGRPLGPGHAPPLAELAAALRLRRSAFTAAADAGASAQALAGMVRVNVGEALGVSAGAEAEARVARTLAGPAPPRVWIDGRLHRREWLRTRGGRVLKTDALDHARSHDLIGAQEIGWDVAGATVEWDLPPADALRLARAARAPPDRLPGLSTAYLAFQLGLATLGAEAQAHDPAEAARLARERDRYAARLLAELAAA